MFKTLLRVLFFISISYQGLFAQSFDSLRFSSGAVSSPLGSELIKLDESTPYTFYFPSDAIDSVKISYQEGQLIAPKIKEALRQINWSLLVYDNVCVIISEPSVESYQYGVWEQKEDTEDYKIIGDSDASPESAITLSGYIRDGKDNNPLIGASIQFLGADFGTITNLNGYYSLQAVPGKYEVLVRYAGYEDQHFSLLLRNTGTMTIELYEATVRLEEVTISAHGQDVAVNEKIAGREVMAIQTIKSLPAFLGEVDPVKSLISLPGISSVGEGTAGYNVRGGEPGQNLLMQDGAILYNSSHMFGFFSAFNPDLLQDVVLYKGGGPANFGGRVSSVMDVNLRNGNAKEFHASGGIGLISSRLTLEGPIKKDKTSFIAGGRISYLNWFLKSTKDVDLRQSAANFHDLNLKINHIQNKNNIFNLSLYQSHDDFRFASDTTYTWNTRQASLAWNHVFSGDLYSMLRLVWSEYHSDISNEDSFNAFQYTSSVKNAGIKLNFNWTPSVSHRIDFGFNALMYDMDPGQLVPGPENANESEIDLDKDVGLESSIYVNDEFSITQNLSLVMGLRVSNYLLFGGDSFVYEPGVPKSEETITDTLQFSSNQVAASYTGLEPRLSMRYLISPQLSLKMSYYRTRQYVHLISNTTAISPVDYWKSSSKNIEPALADQITFGIFKNWKANAFEISGEIYYKKLEQVIDYKDGATILLNETLESDILQGEGRAYGAEFLLRKNRGRLTGWLSYTYSRSERRFNSPIGDEEMINKGMYYPASYDKPHDISLVMNIRTSRRLSIGVNFTYASGRPITMPESKYAFQRIPAVLNYSDRNQYRIPDYHRLDLSFTYKSGLKKDKKLEGEWVLSLYNVYGRKNPYSIFFSQRGNAFQLSILGSIFPSLSYNFKI